MLPRAVRLIRNGGLHPWLNMALDQALEPEPPVLRLYGWDPPGLSLGYFQSAAGVDDAELERRGWVLVRRVTGGGAICHDGDATFSLIARPDDLAFAGSIMRSYDLVHRAVAAGLLRLGVATHPREERPVASDTGRTDEFVCFHRAASFDLLAGDRKLVGSAQRRTKDRVLHHGSIPIARNRLATRATSLEEVLGQVPAWDDVASALAAGFESVLGITLEPSEPAPTELDRARAMVASRFGTDAWNRRR